MIRRLEERLAGPTPPAVWIVGDVMIDRYAFGTVERVSPEAPVPVLRLGETVDRLGGAANVAQNVASLGGRAALAGIVGDDDAGRRLSTLLPEVGVSGRALLTLKRAMTTVKQRAMAGAQQLLRIDAERTLAIDPVEVAALVEGLAAQLPRPDVIIVSDYAKGVVGPGLLAALRARAPGVPILVDPKGHDFTRYAGASVVTPNEREAMLATGIDVRVSDAALEAAARRLRDCTCGADVLVTRGARGMTLFPSDGAEPISAPARASKVFDVTGAGDTAIAALALARAAGTDWMTALAFANAAAGVAVRDVGGVAVRLSDALLSLAHREPGPKRVDRRGLSEVRVACTRAGRRLVFTNGCFDLLHVGHLRLLEAARSLGDVLVVALNTDASVRRLKGEGRPVVTHDDRAALLAGLVCVDYVTLFDEDTPLEAIRACRPDVLVKGADYTPASIVGAADVLSWGGAVHVVPLVPGASTSATVRQLQARAAPSAGE